MANLRTPIQHIYDSLASTYAVAQVGSSYAAKLKWKLIEENLKPESRCLDVGIASGIFAIPAAAECKEVLGLDISHAMLAACRSNALQAGLVNLELIQGSASQLPLVQSYYDLVYSFSTLVLVEDALAAYSSIFRSLKPGGVAILDITGKYNLSRIHWNKYYVLRGHSGINSYTLSEISRIFVDLGFNIKSVFPSGILDQWKYIPFLRYLRFLERVAHLPLGDKDADYWFSSRFPELANRWYFVLEKP